MSIESTNSELSREIGTFISEALIHPIEVKTGGPLGYYIPLEFN